MSEQHVVIIGHMGVGKSTTGRALAESLGWPYLDSDADIEQLLGQTGGELAAERGVALLHELEAALIIGGLARTVPHVITAAASVVENELVQRILPRRAVVVRLVASIETTRERQTAGGHRRAMSANELARLAARREPMFQTLTDLELDAELTTEALVAAILLGLQPELPPGGAGR